MAMMYMQEYPTTKKTNHDSPESQKRMLSISSLPIVLIKTVMKKHACDTDEKTYDTSFLSCISQDMQTQKGIIPLVYILKTTVDYTYLYYTHNFSSLFKKTGISRL